VTDRVLLALDRSGHGREALETTAALASALPAQVLVLHVHETPLAAAIGDEAALRRAGVESAGAARRLVDRAVAGPGPRRPGRRRGLLGRPVRGGPA